jgi:hypothetical protein
MDNPLPAVHDLSFCRCVYFVLCVAVVVSSEHLRICQPLSQILFALTVHAQQPFSLILRSNGMRYANGKSKNEIPQ